MLTKKAQNNLTKTAELESGFRSNIVNPNSKTRGYFQFRDSTLQGLGTSWMNIQNDPKQQIRYAIKLARQSESQLTQEDRLKAYYDPETETVRNVNEDIEVFEEYNDKHTFKNK